MSKKICLLRSPAEISAFQFHGTRPDCSTHTHITKLEAADMVAAGKIRLCQGVGTIEVAHVGVEPRPCAGFRVRRKRRIHVVQSGTASWSPALALRSRPKADPAEDYRFHVYAGRGDRLA